ncbi:MAG TPA: L-threonylcarbamoyladenylate synthase [Thermoanaerobaculia bacterium]|jgi:L-threonylcarbamoyladenylate synthase|nr:L-threonylcarbamoyladenylate synthase [Thermoanaerobaculia bacterium]
MLWSWDDDPTALIEILRRAGVLGIPTESSYALAVDPTDERGVANIFRIKGRADDQALPIVVADLEQAFALGVDREAAGLEAVAALWPAALSIVVPIARPIPASAATATVAIRVPAHARLRALLARTGPLTATSANRSGETPLLDPIATARLLDDADGGVIDDGTLPGGPPSTLVRWEGGGFRVLRAGRFPLDRLPDQRATDAPRSSR